MSKTGRNDPCPCGSGKKFKKCCLKVLGKNFGKKPLFKKKPAKSKFSEYIDNYESGHLLNLLTALQLFPENHGKNFRIELMAIEVVIALSNGKKGDWNKLKQIVSVEFPSHHMEDLPEGLFTENILFHRGNYIVMPGINSHPVEIFRYLTSSIYLMNDDFPEDFKNEVYQGVTIVLALGAILFEQASLKRNMFVESKEKSFLFPDEIRLSFSEKELDVICKAESIDPDIIEYFLTTPDDPEFDIEEPDLSPLLFRPFVRFEGEYYMVMPTAQMSAINEFILQTAKRYNVREELHLKCHKGIWRDIQVACYEMGWMLTDIALPAMKGNSNIKEGIFQFDANLLAYVVYSHPADLKGVYELYEDRKGDLLGQNFLNKRTETVIKSLSSREVFEEYRFLTVVLVNAMGGFSALGMRKPTNPREKKVWFNAFDFLTLVNSGEWERLALWKYAKVFEITANQSKLLVTSSVDAYATYKRNGESFYISDDPRPDLLTIVPGDGADFTREAKIKSDVHGTLCLNDGSLVYVWVRRYRDYAPIYLPVNQRIGFEMLLEHYELPIWIQNYQAKDKGQANLVEHISDAICFWLYKLWPALSDVFTKLKLPLLNIILEFDASHFEPLPMQEMNSMPEIVLNTEYSFEGYELTLRFPKLLHKAFVGGNNEGERNLIKIILNAFNEIPSINLSEDFISEALDQYVPLGPAKMILILDSRTDIQLDNRWLLPSLYISDAEVNLLLDNLVEIINSPTPIPKEFKTPKEKKQFCNNTVSSLINHLKKKLNDFGHEVLVKRLIEINERIIHNREYGRIKTSAQIYCFGDDENQMEKILKRERKILNTSISSRCLIEFVVQSPTTGSKYPSYDELDELLAIMNEILNFGMQSDVIHFGMANPEMGLLPSGRIGTSKEFYDEKLQPFHHDNTKANIEAHLEAFSDQFETYTASQGNEGDKAHLDKVDAAFLADWGVDYTNLIGICMQAVVIGGLREQSVVSLSEAELITELEAVMPGEISQIHNALAKLRFEYNETALDTKGYANSEYFPWKYNREFSYVRRPFVVVNEGGTRMYYWGIRNCVSASRYLHQLLYSGQLTDGGPNINGLLGEIRMENGKHFRNLVMDWLIHNTNLNVWSYEVTIKPGGHLDADKDYGDIDVFAYDPKSSVVYNIECKRTVAARNIHQMKNEMDSYLGRAGQKKKVSKHVERDKWLQQNLDKIHTLLETETPCFVKSIIVTSELIPTRYLRAEDIEIPIISFQELKILGL